MRHRIVFAIAGPERGLMLDRGCGDESIWDFQAMAARVFVKQTACRDSGFIIGRQTDEQLEECGKHSMFLRPCACPNFRHYQGGAEDGLPREDQFGPLRENLLITSPQNLDDDIGVDENIHRMPSRFRRVPLRRLRT